jgi:hypothetical protein
MPQPLQGWKSIPWFPRVGESPTTDATDATPIGVEDPFSCFHKVGEAPTLGR